MNKLLTFFWIIIIVGAVLLGIRMFGPDAAPVQNGDTTPTDIPEEIGEVTKTYKQYMTEGLNATKELDYNSAITAYTLASKANDDKTDPLYALADAYSKNAQPRNAETVYRKIQQEEGESDSLQLKIIQSLIDQRRIETAKELLWEMETEDPETKYLTAVMLILYKDFEGSKKLFKELLVAHEAAQKSQDPDTVLIPEIIVENSEIFLEAFETFEIYTGGENIHQQTLLAKALTDTQQFEASIPLLYDVINEKNNYRDAWIVLGYAYLKTNKTLDAIDALNQARALNEEKPETLFFLGLAYFANDEIDKAVIFLEEAKKFDYQPKDQLDLKLGDLYLLQQQYKKSSKRYEEVLAVNTDNLSVFIRVVWLNIDKLNNPSKALNYASTALELFPESAMSHNLVGWSLTALDNFQEAEKHLKYALELDPNFDAATLNLGWFYEKQGMQSLAKEYYKRAYNLSTDSSIGSLAATRFNNLLQANISAPSVQTP